MYRIGDKIAELRKNRKMTQEELANIVGVSAQSVSKWETSQTMPDIMLLPSLAAALDVTVNDLFSIASGSNSLEKINPDKATEAAYSALFNVLQQAVSGAESISKDQIASNMNRIRTTDYAQSGLVSYDDGEACGGVYANSSIGLCFDGRRSDALKLLDDDNVVPVLSILADKNARLVLKFMLSNDGATMTSNVIANRCGISTEDAVTALNNLFTIHLVDVRQVETGEDNPINVYICYGSYKMHMLVYPILELSRTLYDWHEFWMGFRC